MPLHPYLRRAVNAGSFILLYGEPGVGKTALSLEIARTVLRDGEHVCVVATETGTLLALRHSEVDVEARVTLSHDALPVTVLNCVAEGKYVVVDSINSLYRLDPGMRQAALLSMTSALLRASAAEGVGGAATAQVSLDGSEVPGWSFIAPWATHIARLERKGATTWVRVEKPERVDLAFTIREGGLEWL